MPTYECRRLGAQVGNNDDAVTLVSIDEDGAEDEIAVLATMTLAEHLKLSLEEADCIADMRAKLTDRRKAAAADVPDARITVQVDPAPDAVAVNFADDPDVVIEPDQRAAADKLLAEMKTRPAGNYTFAIEPILWAFLGRCLAKYLADPSQAMRNRVERHLSRLFRGSTVAVQSVTPRQLKVRVNVTEDRFLVLDLEAEGDAPQRITRNRYLTPEEAARNQEIVDQVDQELPELVQRHHERMGHDPGDNYAHSFAEVAARRTEKGPTLVQRLAQLLLDEFSEPDPVALVDVQSEAEWRQDLQYVWRKYVPESIQGLWPELDLQARLLACYLAYKAAEDADNILL